MTDHRNSRDSLYAEVTARVIAELEAGCLPWVRPWDKAACACTMPVNASTARPYSGINILILWDAACRHSFTGQRWLTYRQAEALGAHVRRGERGTTICYADRFTPEAERTRAEDEAREARAIAFLKRFTVFNTDQIDDLPDELTVIPEPLAERQAIDRAEALITATGATIQLYGDEAWYSPSADLVRLPPQQAFPDQINFYRTAFHELGHWTGHSTRLDRDQTGRFGSDLYAREELVAEMASAFVCASLAIEPTVRHADYIGSWLAVLRADDRAIFRAASQASKAADLLLAFETEA